MRDDLCEFIKDFNEDLDSLELLLFFGRHPNARFNQRAVIHSTSLRRFEEIRSLKNLVDKGLVSAQTENGTTLYSLTLDCSSREKILGLRDIDQSQWQTIVDKLIQNLETA